MIKVSVIIPVYDVEKYLPDCLDSVLKQTLKDIEVICIDDASPDHCGAILDAYAEQDNRLRVLHLPENRQQGYGRNRGLELARGRYVYFLDSDDMITDNALEKLYSLAERDHLDSVFFDSQVIYESEKLAERGKWYISGRNGNYEDRICTGRELYDAFASQNDWTVFIQRQFWNRECLISNEIYFPENTEHEDEFFSFKGILLAQKVRYIPERFFIHRFREKSVMTRRKNAKDFHGYFRCYFLMSEMLDRYGIFGEYIDKNLDHIYEWMVMTWPLFAGKEDYKKWFQSETEQMLYRFFANSRKAEVNNAKRFSRILADALPYQDIWIYGAGMIGSRVYHGLSDIGCHISGFLVTNKTGNPDTLFGCPVMAVENIKSFEDKFAIVCVSKSYTSEVVRILESKGWHYTVYR